MPEFLTRLLSSDELLPRGHCYAWKAGFVWLQVISDLLIALAYTSIPFTLVHLMRKRKDIPFKGILLSFAIFIIACAITHGVEVWTLWKPTSWLSGLVKIVAAATSVTTALLLTKLLPAVLTCPPQMELRQAHDEPGNTRHEAAKLLAAVAAAAEGRMAQATRRHGPLGSGLVDDNPIEPRLSPSEFRFRPIVGAGATGVITADLAGRILETNTAFLDMLGRGGSEALRRPLPWSDLIDLQTDRVFAYCRSELVGHASALLLPERFRRGHDGHGPQRFAPRPGFGYAGSGLEFLVAPGELNEIPIELRTSSQRAEPAGRSIVGEDPSADWAPNRDGLEGRAPMETTAKVLGDRFATAVDTIQDAIALFDHEDRLILCNASYRTLVGGRLEGSLVGRRYEELLDAWSLDLDFPQKTALQEFRIERLATRLQEATSIFHVRTRLGRSLRAIDRKTPEGGIVTVISDSSDDERRAEECRAACNVAEEASAAKSEFLSSMSHELRTPLNAILGFAQLLRGDKKEPLSERHRERIDHILTGGEHLLRLIDDILDLSRIEAGGMSVSIEPVNVVDVLDEVKSALSPTATQQGIAIQVELPGQIPMVSADRTRFAQILLNFGSNGVKYNRPAGTITFVVSTPRPEIVRVLVRDTGIGIPADMQRKIFQPFQRAGQEMGPIQGTGIGLVITRRLALLMGGDVDFRSIAGQGSEFWVDLPRHSSEIRSSPPPAAREEGTARAARQMRRLVLYVEDNPANVTFMEDFASTLENVELVSVPTAEVGVDFARRRRPQVVIMDINLPGMNGIEALRALRSVPETKDVPVIALTAAASQRDRERGVQAGFHQYLTKPVKVTELVTTLEALFTPASGDIRWSTAGASSIGGDLPTV